MKNLLETLKILFKMLLEKHFADTRNKKKKKKLGRNPDNSL